VFPGSTGGSHLQATGINEKNISWGYMSEFDKEESKRLPDPTKRAQAHEIISHIPEDKLPFPKEYSFPLVISSFLFLISFFIFIFIFFFPRRPEEVRLALERIKESRQKVTLNSTSRPSICCYTFHNTYDGMCSLNINQDCSLMSAGFSDSYIQIHSVNGDNLRKLGDGMKVTDMELQNCIPPCIFT